MLALLEPHHILHVSRTRVKTLQLLIVPAPDIAVAKKAAAGDIYAQLSSALGVQRLSCCTSPLTSRREHRLRVFRQIMGSDRKELTRNCRTLHDYEFHDLSCTLNIIRMIKSRRWDGRGMWHAWWRGEVYTGVGWGNMKNRDHLEDAGAGRMVILKLISKK